MMKLYKVGRCRHPERITDAQGSWRVIEFPAMAAAIEHPTQGIILYDTGYAKHFAQHTKRFPYNLYPLITPVLFREEESLANQLADDGIAAGDVRAIIISHYHGDHIAGLRDFPKARLISSRAGYEHARFLNDFFLAPESTPQAMATMTLGKPGPTVHAEDALVDTTE